LVSENKAGTILSMFAAFDVIEPQIFDVLPPAEIYRKVKRN